MKNNLILTFFILLILSGCVGTGSKGVFGTGVSIALDPRSLGTQIDDSIMQKNLLARLALTEKKYLIHISVKVLDGRIFLGGKVDEPEEKLKITKMAWETKGARSVKNDLKIKEKFDIKVSAKDFLILSQLKSALIFNKNIKASNYHIDVYKKKIFIYGSDGNNCSSFISEILSPNKDIKENHHYINNPIRQFTRPKVLLKIHWVNNFIPENPAKKKGIKKGFMIEGINDLEKLDLTSFHQEIRNSKGKEITLLIRTDQNEPEIMKIKPIRLNEEDESDAKYTLGFSAQEKEQDPLFLELEKKYKRLPKKNTNVRK